MFYGRRDFLIGRTEHIWEQDGRRYRMTSLVETVGLTALLHSLRYAQHSEGQVTAHGLQPERFWVDQTGKGEEYAEFDWEAREATIHRQRARLCRARPAVRSGRPLHLASTRLAGRPAPASTLDVGA